ncbi:MAG: class I SAM-dependent methyltransferase [Desulfohalobiaceae bacterium]|nr:class I SAM-dependent methyltransferase [Desulfohalobiaceae bacterium]
MEAKKRPLFQQVLEEAAIGPGSNILDVGCGAGTFCALASSRGAAAMGLDASRNLLDIAREQGGRDRFLQGEMQELPFPDRCFDLVTGFNAFQYAAEAEHALREAARVTRRGGRIVIAVYGKPEDCDTAEYISALSQLMPPPPPNTPGPFALSRDGALQEFVFRAGLEPQLQRDVSVPWDFPDGATAVRALLSSGPAAKAIEHAGESRVREAIQSVLPRFRTTTEDYVLHNKFRYLVAGKL